MKRTVAQWLRRLAYRIDPDYLKSVDIEWRSGWDPWVDIQFYGIRQRVTGYVDIRTAK